MSGHDGAAEHAPAPRPGRGRAELRRVLPHVRRVRLSRGRGAHALHTLVAHARGESPLGDAEESALASVIESLIFAVEDAEAVARRPRPPWR